MRKLFKTIRNISFAVNVLSCCFLILCVACWPSALGVKIFDLITIHIASMCIIFVSVFLTAVMHQLYVQECE